MPSSGVPYEFLLRGPFYAPPVWNGGWARLCASDMKSVAVDNDCRFVEMWEVWVNSIRAVMDSAVVKKSGRSVTGEREENEGDSVISEVWGFLKILL